MYIHAPDGVTPEWLTVVLRQDAVIGPGEVIAVEILTTSAFNSHTSHLALTYSSEVAADAPKHLVLKRNIEVAWGIEAGMDLEPMTSSTCAPHSGRLSSGMKVNGKRRSCAVIMQVCRLRG